MATPNRGYNEIPGNVAPDVPFYTNAALRQVDKDVQGVETASTKRDDDQKLRISQLEAAAGFPNNPVQIADGNVSAVLNDASSSSSASVRRIVEEQAFPYADLDIMRARLGARNTSLVNVLVAGSSTANGGGATDYDTRSIGGLLATAIYQAYPKQDGTPHYAITDLAGAAASTKTAPGIRFVRAGIGGATTATYLPQADIDKAKALNPGAIFHIIGSNDFAAQMPIATFKANLSAKLDALSSLTDTAHILVHQFPRQDITTPAIPWKDYGTAMRQVAEARTNVVFADISRPFIEMGLPGVDTFDLVSGDLIHASDAGHAVMAKSLTDLLMIVPQKQDTGWQQATPSAPYTHRAGFAMSYRVIDGVVYWRGGVVKTDGSAIASGFQAVATFPEALAPEQQNTGVGSAGVGGFCMRFAQVNGVLVVWPSAATSGYIMFTDMMYPLGRLAN